MRKRGNWGGRKGIKGEDILRFREDADARRLAFTFQST